MVKKSERISFCYLVTIGILLMSFLPLYYLSAQQEIRFPNNTPVLSSYHELPDQTTELNEKEVIAETEESENKQEKFQKHVQVFGSRNLSFPFDSLVFVLENNTRSGTLVHEATLALHKLHCIYLI